MTETKRHFSYDVETRYLPLLLCFGLRRSRDGVTITNDTFNATFGIVRISTPLSNVEGAHVTRNYHWWKALGTRLSFADGGLTFGTTCTAGVCVHFREPVPSPLRRRGHTALTVTVADLDELVERLQPATEDR